MPASDVPLALIFDALDAAVAASSQGEVARQVGMTSTGLKKLLQSRKPGWGATEQKVRRWYLRHAAQTGPDERAARAALEVLLSGMEDAEREKARRAILKALEKGHGGEPPEWLAGLRVD